MPRLSAAPAPLSNEDGVANLAFRPGADDRTVVPGEF